MKFTTEKILSILTYSLILTFVGGLVLGIAFSDIASFNEILYAIIGVGFLQVLLFGIFLICCTLVP